MTKLSDHQIADALGLPKPVAPEAVTAAAKAAQDIVTFDSRIDALVDQHRAPGETHAAAYDRLLAENPSIYAAHVRQKQQALQRHGLIPRPNGG